MKAPLFFCPSLSWFNFETYSFPCFENFALFSAYLWSALTPFPLQLSRTPSVFPIVLSFLIPFSNPSSLSSSFSIVFLSSKSLCYFSAPLFFLQFFIHVNLPPSLCLTTLALCLVSSQATPPLVTLSLQLNHRVPPYWFSSLHLDPSRPRRSATLSNLYPA